MNEHIKISDSHTVVIDEVKRYRYLLIGNDGDRGYATSFSKEYPTKTEALEAAKKVVFGPPDLGVHIRDGIGTKDKVGG